MTVRRNYYKTRGNRKARPRHLFRKVAWLIIFAAIICIVSYKWLIPVLIRDKIEQKLSEICGGPVQVGDLRINHTGHVLLDAISIYDKSEQKWLAAEKINVALADWLSLSPIVKEVEIDTMNLQISSTEGKLNLPQMNLPDRSDDAEQDSLTRKILIKNAVISVTDEQGSQITFDNLTFSAVGINEIYEFQLNQIQTERSEILSAGGSVNFKDMDFDISLQINHQFTKAETNILSESLNANGVSAEGYLQADVQISGPLKQLQQWHPEGFVKLHNWAVEDNDTKTRRIFNTNMEFISSGIHLKDISIRDTNDIDLLSAQNANIGLDNWPGLNPTLSEIEIESPKLRAIYLDNIFIIPSLLSTGNGTGSTIKFPDIQRLSISNAEIIVKKMPGQEVVLDRLQLNAVKQKDIYDISINRRTENDSNSIAITGTINPESLNVDLSMMIDSKIKKSETDLLFEAMNIPKFLNSGDISADLKIKGSIKEPNELIPTGTIKLKDCIIESEDNKFLCSINTLIDVNDKYVSLTDLAVRDANGLEWLSADTSAVTFKNWPGLQPVLTEIETDGLKLFVYLIDDKISLPIEMTSAESEDQMNNNFNLSHKILQNLQKINVRNALIGIANRENAKLTFDSLLLKPAEQQGFYEIAMIYNKAKEPEPDMIRLNGVVNPTTTEANLSLVMNHIAQKEETAVVFAALGMPDASGEGKLIADLKIAGLLNEPSKLQSGGSVKLEQGTLFIKDQIMANNIVTTGILEGKSLNFDRFDALVCNGPASGSIFIQVKQDKQIEYGGQFSGEKMSFVELTSIFSGPGKKATKGFVKFNYYFTADSNSFESLRGNGQIILDDADMTAIPIIPYLFRLMGLVKLDPLNVSDVQCVFSMTGPVVEIRNAHIANPFGAIEIEPGGTINLQKQSVDMYAIALPLRQIDNFARRIPLADILFNLKDKLTRFYIRGQWSLPPTKLITKTPIKDIREGTTGFFMDVARNGGHFGQKMLDGFRAFLPAKQNNKK